ncbi:MAG: diaminopropionate ammonia-lyase [Sphaerochaetaceae bacterium]
MTKGNSDFSYLLRDGELGDLKKIKETFSKEMAYKALNFHQQIPGYKMSPLVKLANLSKLLGVGGIWVKNEACRLDLNSFKVLGGSFALYRFIQDKLNIDDSLMSYNYLFSDNVRNRLKGTTFASATDGNHGKGLAWAAGQLGYECVIYVHKDTSQNRIDAISQYGAKVVVIDGNYDDAVSQIIVDAQKYGWQIISDTSWEGYHKIPTSIMQGYATIVLEAQQQLNSLGIAKPSHVFVQAGVGALAAAIFGYYHSLLDKDAPLCSTVEPDNAACIYTSALLNDGSAHQVEGDLETIMAGLSCGMPSEVAWDILKTCVTSYIKTPDYFAARGMRMYASPLADDAPIISGESGAVTLGLLVALLKQEGGQKLKEALKLDDKSHILLINTEGDTDPLHYRHVVWEGSNPTPSEYYFSEGLST